MQFPTVSKCCCCVDLKAAGIIIGTLSIICAVYDIASGGAWSIVSMIYIPLTILWLVGIFQEKPALMLPTIIADAIGIILFSLTPIYIFVVYRSVENDSHSIFIQYFAQPLILIFVVLIISIYIFIIEYSLYRVLVDRKNTSAQDQPVKYEVWSELVKIGKEIKRNETVERKSFGFLFIEGKGPDLGNPFRQHYSRFSHSQLV